MSSPRLSLLPEFRSVKSFHDEYIFDPTTDRIGSGAFSVVYRAKVVGSESTRGRAFATATSTSGEELTPSSSPMPSSTTGRPSGWGGDTATPGSAPTSSSSSSSSASFHAPDAETHCHHWEEDSLPMGQEPSERHPSDPSKMNVVALKVISKKRLESNKHVRDVVREARMLSSNGDEPGLVKLLDCLQTKSEVALVMNLVEGVELGKILRKTGRFPENVARVVMAQLLSILDHMHKRDGVHRDLKPDNVLLCLRQGSLREHTEKLDEGFTTDVDAFRIDQLADAAANNRLQVYLVDFGFARGVRAATGMMEVISSERTTPSSSPVGTVKSFDDLPKSAKIQQETFTRQNSDNKGSWNVPTLQQQPPTSSTSTGTSGARGAVGEDNKKDGLVTTGSNRSSRSSSSTPDGPIPTSACTPTHGLASPMGDLAKSSGTGGGGDRMLEDESVFLSTCGADRFLAPELLKVLLEGSDATKRTTTDLAKRVDMYSAGVLAYVMLSGCFPFCGKSRSTLLLQELNGPKFTSNAWSGVSDGAKSLLQKMLCPDPELRPSSAEASSELWLLEKNVTKDNSHQHCMREDRK